MITTSPPLPAPVNDIAIGGLEPRLDTGNYSVPPRILAIQLSESQLGVIRAWINGELRPTAPDLAEAIRASSTAMLAMLSV